MFFQLILRIDTLSTYRESVLGACQRASLFIVDIGPGDSDPNFCRHMAPLGHKELALNVSCMHHANEYIVIINISWWLNDGWCSVW